MLTNEVLLPTEQLTISDTHAWTVYSQFKVAHQQGQLAALLATMTFDDLRVLQWALERLEAVNTQESDEVRTSVLREIEHRESEMFGFGRSAREQIIRLFEQELADAQDRQSSVSSSNVMANFMARGSLEDVRHLDPFVRLFPGTVETMPFAGARDFSTSLESEHEMRAVSAGVQAGAKVLAAGGSAFEALHAQAKVTLEILGNRNPLPFNPDANEAVENRANFRSTKSAA